MLFYDVLLYHIASQNTQLAMFYLSSGEDNFISHKGNLIRLCIMYQTSQNVHTTLSFHCKAVKDIFKILLLILSWGFLFPLLLCTYQSEVASGLGVQWTCQGILTRRGVSVHSGNSDRIYRDSLSVRIGMWCLGWHTKWNCYHEIKEEGVDSDSNNPCKWFPHSPPPWSVRLIGALWHPHFAWEQNGIWNYWYQNRLGTKPWQGQLYFDYKLQFMFADKWLTFDDSH